jgi:hypothetical protein
MFFFAAQINGNQVFSFLLHIEIKEKFSKAFSFILFIYNCEQIKGFHSNNPQHFLFQLSPILIAVWVYGQVPMVLLSLVEIYLATALLTRGYAVHPGNREAIKNTAYYVGGHSIFLSK